MLWNDVGANVGFFTLLASRLVGPSGRVLSFEPFPGALTYLRRHLELNNVNNATVVAAAVSDVSARVGFRAHENLTMGRLADGGELAVDAGLPAPDLIKIDVEGEEAKVLRGAETLLREKRPTLLLATHGSATHAECCVLLGKYAYLVEPLPYEMTTPEFDFLGELAAIPAAVIS